MKAIDFIILVCMHGFECTIIITADTSKTFLVFSFPGFCSFARNFTLWV